MVSFTRSMNGYARFRDIRQAPDGKIYAMTNSPNRFVLLSSNVPVFTSSTQHTKKSRNTDKLYPNPSAGKSSLSFFVAKNELISVRIYNTNGALIKALKPKSYSTGHHKVSLNFEDIPKGLYILEIDKGNTQTFIKWLKI